MDRLGLDRPSLSSAVELVREQLEPLRFQYRHPVNHGGHFVKIEDRSTMPQNCRSSAHWARRRKRSSFVKTRGNLPSPLLKPLAFLLSFRRRCCLRGEFASIDEERNDSSPTFSLSHWHLNGQRQLFFFSHSCDIHRITCWLIFERSISTWWTRLSRRSFSTGSTRSIRLVLLNTPLFFHRNSQRLKNQNKNDRIESSFSFFVARPSPIRDHLLGSHRKRMHWPRNRWANQIRLHLGWLAYWSMYLEDLLLMEHRWDEN